MNTSNILNRYGLKITLPRVMVYEELLTGPKTFERLRTKLAIHHINLSTLYRVIDSFRAAGLLIENGEGSRRIIQLSHETPVRDVHHVVCRQCQHIESFHDSSLEELVGIIAQQYGLAHLDSHVIELHGVCNSCNHDLLSTSLAE